MPFIEKTDRADMIEPGDEVTLEGQRGTVVETVFRLARLTLTNEQGVAVVYTKVSSPVLVHGEDGAVDYSPEFLSVGDDVTAEGHRGTLSEPVGFADLWVTLATDDGIVNLRLTGNEQVLYHNWFVHPEPECQVCLEGIHHGPPTVRCHCCGRHMNLWTFNFADVS